MYSVLCTIYKMIFFFLYDKKNVCLLLTLFLGLNIYSVAPHDQPHSDCESAVQGVSSLLKLINHQ